MKSAVIIIMAMLFVASSVVFAAGVPKGSFLHSSVQTVEQLAQQVIDDPIVAGRYAKYFQQSRDSVASYFQSSLRIGALKGDYDTTVYSIGADKSIVATRTLLPVGSYVFVDLSGRPILDARTGNPIGHVSLNAAEQEALVTQVSEDGIVTKVLGAPAVEAGNVPGALAPVSAGTGSVVGVAPAIEVVSAIPTDALGAAIGHSSGRGVLPLLAVAGGLAAAGGGGSASSASDKSFPVPEPSSMMGMALGAVAVVSFGLRRKIRR